MGSLDGKVAFISGAARGQGRAHAVRMAQEGADIIGFDICEQLDTVTYAMATPQDLEETARLVKDAGRRMLFGQADVRDQAAVQRVLEIGLAELDHVDIVVANAGIFNGLGEQGRSPQAWHDALDVLLTGVYHTCEAAIPVMMDQDRGGSIIITSSTAGLKGIYGDRKATSAGVIGYAAAKHGVVGLMRIYATSLAPYRIRSNTIHPTGVETPMVMNEEFGQFFRDHPDVLNRMQNLLPIPAVQPEDIANAASSTDLKLMTGVCLVLEHEIVDLTKAVATLDDLSGGRFRFGVGVGWNREELANVSSVPWSKRYHALRESIAAMRALWANDEAGYEGEYVRIAPSWVWPKPTRPTGPPVLMGCQGRVGLRHVAEYADEWCPLDVGFRDVGRGLGWFRDAVVAADRDPDTIPISLYCFDNPTAENVDRYAKLGVDRVVFNAPDERDKHNRFLDRCQPLVDEFASKN